jgi:hypothetical protein
MTNCGVIYATGDPAKPATRCSKRAERGKGSPCKEHRRHLELLNEPGREAIKARYEVLVRAFQAHEDATKAAGKDPRAALRVTDTRAELRRAARGRDA